MPGIGKGGVVKPVFLHDWASVNWRSQTGVEAMAYDFRIEQSQLKGVQVLLAAYTYEDYAGSAFVLFRRRGKLYEVNGSHCSCYGLEGQWDPTEVTKKELMHRIEHGSLGAYYGNKFADELKSVLKKVRAA
jgi:hypothetical protein